MQSNTVLSCCSSAIKRWVQHHHGRLNIPSIQLFSVMNHLAKRFWKCCHFRKFDTTHINIYVFVTLSSEQENYLPKFTDNLTPKRYTHFFHLVTRTLSPGLRTIRGSSVHGTQHATLSPLEQGNSLPEYASVIWYSTVRSRFSAFCISCSSWNDGDRTSMQSP